MIFPVTRNRTMYRAIPAPQIVHPGTKGFLTGHIAFIPDSHEERELFETIRVPGSDILVAISPSLLRRPSSGNMA